MKKGAKSENALNENALSGALNSIDKVSSAKNISKLGGNDRNTLIIGKLH